ncbi:MAG: DUF1353 domain-containing protein [Victivallales bacterium]|nr:DUF1353 domain-containing protein [Victivallales bacterium]
MLVDIHRADNRGNIFTLREVDGLKISWRGRQMYVPCGFQSDGVSVPRFFWRLVFPPGDQKALRAGLAHDYVYRRHPYKWTKADADRMFRDLLRADGVPNWRAQLAYLGVHWFGGGAWRARGR